MFHVTRSPAHEISESQFVGMTRVADVMFNPYAYDALLREQVMLARSAALAALLLLAACAGVQSVGRGSVRAPASGEDLGPLESTSPEAPPQVEPPPVAAANVQAPEATASPRPRDDNEIVVPGQVEQQVPAPRGDPRSRLQRMEDVRAWDQCVTEVQSAFESDPVRPQLDTPEEYCRRSLGMADRLAVPASRRR